MAQITGVLAGGDANIPLLVSNQKSGGGGATPGSLTPGFGGIDIVQNTVATSAVANFNSPYLRLCAQEWVGSGSAMAQCWKLQVTAQNSQNPPDVIEWTRDTGNTTGNITMRWPAAINLASAGQMTVGPSPNATQDDSANLSTFTGQKTSFAMTGSKTSAGPITIEPGQLTASSPDASSVEGALQILQSYWGVSPTTSGLLACPTGTAQQATACTTKGQAENWVGVLNSIAGAQGVTVTPLRYGRVPVSSVAGTNVQYTNGDFVCKDDANAGVVIDNSTTPCPLGESVGVAVGDASSGTSHLVDLIPEASTAAGALLTFFCTGQVGSGTGAFYIFPSSTAVACNTATSTQVISSFSGHVRNLEVFYTNNPGTGKADTFAVLICPARNCTGVTASLTCQISGAGTSGYCHDITDSTTVSEGDGIQITDTPTVSPSTGAGARVTIEIQ